VKTDGYPVITRCYKNGKVSLDLTFQSLSRTPISDDIFVVPAGYKKMDMMMSPGR